MKARKSIPTQTKRDLFIESGYHCSIRQCKVDSALDFHHIDGNPSNNEVDNLLVVCSNHHRACTVGTIDKKACLQIKRSLKVQNIPFPKNQLTAEKLRKVFREELNSTSTTRLSRTTAFPSVLNRKYLFRMVDNYLRFIDKNNKPTCHLYLAVMLIGEMRYRGGSKRIVDLITAMKKTNKKKRFKEFEFYYRTVIESLAKIGNKESLSWLAEEFCNKKQDYMNRFIIFMALGSNKNAYRYTGFKIMERKIEKTDKGNISKIYFRLRGNNYRMFLETEA